MNILALTWKHPQDPTAGGAERYLVEVASRWVQSGHGVTIFGPSGPAAPWRTGPGTPNRITYVGSGSRLTVFRQARAYLRTHGATYDAVLETVSTRPFAAHRVVGRRAVALYYQTAEEVWGHEFPLPVAVLGRYLLEPRWVRSLRDASVVAISPSTANALQRFGVRAQGVVPPGCDVPTEVDLRDRPSDAPHLLWIGRMVRTKRPEDAISGHALLRARIPAASLEMVGTGYLHQQLAARQSPGVRLRGPVSDREKRSLLAQADLVLLPGTREGWGIVAMEAAAYGVPVIAYDVPGLRDAVVDGVTGVLVEPNPLALAAAAIRVLSDQRAWSRFSKAARERALAFSWDRCARDLLECLTSRFASTGAQGAPANSLALPGSVPTGASDPDRPPEPPQLGSVACPRRICGKHRQPSWASRTGLTFGCAAHSTFHETSERLVQAASQSRRLPPGLPGPSSLP